MVQWVKEIILSNHRVSVARIAQELDGRQFSNDNQVQTAVLSWIQDQGAIVYRQAIERLVLRSDKCLQRLGDYVEKYVMYACHIVL